MRRFPILCLAIALFGVACAETAAVEPPTTISTTQATAPVEPATATSTTQDTAPVDKDPCAVGNEGGAMEYSVEIDGYTRAYTVYAPDGDGTSPSPMLIALHGFTATPQRFEARTHLGESGARNGIIVVLPRGSGPISRWNFTELLAPPDDVSFLRQLIEDVSGRYCTGSIHLAGFSNGAALAAVAGCALERISSILVVAGNQLPGSCSAGPRSLIAIHALDDPAVPYRGLDIGAFGAFPGVDDTMTRWAEVAGCTDKADTQIAPDVVHRVWQECAGDVSIYIVTTAGHTWPGSADATATSSIDATAIAIDQVLATRANS